MAGRFSDILRSASGSLMPATAVSVYTAGSGTLATLYRDAAGTVAQDNPVTADMGTAQVDFYAAPGLYDLRVGGSLIAESVPIAPAPDDVDDGPYLPKAGATLTAVCALAGAATTTDMISAHVTADTQKRLIVNAGGTLEWGSGADAVDTNLYRSAADTLKTDDDLVVVGSVTSASLGTGAIGATDHVSISVAGKGLAIKEGANAKMGAATMVDGAVVVETTAVTASSRVFLTVQSLGTVAAPKAIAVTARTASTSFTITSADATDTSVVAWMLVEPAA